MNYSSLYNFFTAHQLDDIEVIFPDGIPDSQKVIDIDLATISVFKPLTLTQQTDFKNWTFRVKNAPSDFKYLFYLAKSQVHAKGVFLSKRQIDTGNFEDVAEFSSYNKVLVHIEDKNPWCHRQTASVSEDFFRSDILLVENGRAINKVIAPYQTCESNPVCKYMDGDGGPYVFKNLNFVRDSTCHNNFGLLLVTYLDDVTIENVSISTPYTYDIVGDLCIRVYNSTNVMLKNISIDKTYSTEEHSGYGFNCINVWNLNVVNVNGATPRWGVFGNRSINTATIKNSVLNRFDVHCYGRDIYCKDCEFKNENVNPNNTQTYHAMNRYSGMYGYIRYEKCTFKDFRPLRIDHEYNAYSGFDVYFKDCIMEFRRASFNCLVELNLINNTRNLRQELNHKALPNIIIEGKHNENDVTEKGYLEVRVASWADYLNLFHIYNAPTYSEGLGYLSNIVGKIEWRDLNGEELSATDIQDVVLKDSLQAINVAQRLVREIETTSGIQTVYNITGITS